MGLLPSHSLTRPGDLRDNVLALCASTACQPHPGMIHEYSGREVSLVDGYPHRPPGSLTPKTTELRLHKASRGLRLGAGKPAVIV